MRELKFRAWSIEYEEYIEDVIHDGSSWLEAYGYDYVTVSEIFDGDEFIVEQYTGLKDKNGKEIYEGDIVASSYFGKDRILKVVFYEGCFCLCETRLEIPYPGFVYYFRQGSRFRPQDDYAVIGNIHENLELLEGEQ